MTCRELQTFNCAIISYSPLIVGQFDDMALGANIMSLVSETEPVCTDEERVIPSPN